MTRNCQAADRKSLLRSACYSLRGGCSSLYMGWHAAGVSQRTRLCEDRPAAALRAPLCPTASLGCNLSVLKAPNPTFVLPTKEFDSVLSPPSPTTHPLLSPRSPTPISFRLRHLRESSALGPGRRSPRAPPTATAKGAASSAPGAGVAATTTRAAAADVTGGAAEGPRR